MPRYEITFRFDAADTSEAKTVWNNVRDAVRGNTGPTVGYLNRRGVSGRMSELDSPVVPACEYPDNAKGGN